METLKWNKKNYKFWTDEIKAEKIYGLDSDFYNKKTDELIENDIILLETLNAIDKEYQEIKNERVKYEELIPHIIESIDYDINKFIDIYKLFDNYAKGMKLLYFNPPIELKNIKNIIDSVIFFDIDGDGKWDFVIEKGVKKTFEQYIAEGGKHNPGDSDLSVIKSPEDIDMCKKEYTYVTTEYDFC